MHDSYRKHLAQNADPAIRRAQNNTDRQPMKTPDTSVCAICGSNAGLLRGRCGIACRKCIASAASGIIIGTSNTRGPLSAADFCLLCGESIVTKGNVAAFSGPYRLCFACVRDVLDISNELTDGVMSQVPIGGS
jgi:hypothetical protein